MRSTIHNAYIHASMHPYMLNSHNRHLNSNSITLLPSYAFNGIGFLTDLYAAILVQILLYKHNFPLYSDISQNPYMAISGLAFLGANAHTMNMFDSLHFLIALLTLNIRKSVNRP